MTSHTVRTHSFRLLFLLAVAATTCRADTAAGTPQAAKQPKSGPKSVVVQAMEQELERSVGGWPSPRPIHSCALTDSELGVPRSRAAQRGRGFSIPPSPSVAKRESSIQWPSTMVELREYLDLDGRSRDSAIRGTLFGRIQCPTANGRTRVTSSCRN